MKTAESIGPRFDKTTHINKKWAGLNLKVVFNNFKKSTNL